MNYPHAPINIAIFGLSLRMLHELKERTANLVADHFQINWTNIVEPDLNVLMINEHFYDAPSIQQLIHNNQIHVLKLVNSNKSELDPTKDTLALPLQDEQKLLNWLKINVLQSQTAPTQPEVDHEQELLQQLKFLKELLSNQNGQIKIFDQHGFIGVADTRHGWMWLPKQQLLKARESRLNFTYATAQEFTQHQQEPCVELKSWLWNMVWHSPMFHQQAFHDGYYKLNFWPQPLDPNDSREILRMAACFVRGAKLSQVAAHLEIPAQRVQQFMLACTAVDYMQRIPEQRAKFAPKVRYGLENNQGLFNLFGKLRKKLGL